MKNLILFVLLLTATHVMAQDVIVKKDGSTIVSKVLEITANEVKYKKFTNLEGPTYTIAKTEIQVINYENGEKEAFGEDKTPIVEAPIQEPTYKNDQENNQFQQLSYQELLNMSGGTVSTNKIKTLKTIGWIGGSVLAAGGIFMMIAPDFFEDDLALFSSDDYVPVYGGIMIAAGAAWTTGFLLSANHIKKKYGLTSINSIPLIQKELTLKNGTSLAAGVDILNDSRIHSQALGVGLRYQF